MDADSNRSWVSPISVKIFQETGKNLFMKQIPMVFMSLYFVVVFHISTIQIHKQDILYQQFTHNFMPSKSLFPVLFEPIFPTCIESYVRFGIFVNTIIPCKDWSLWNNVFLRKKSKLQPQMERPNIDLTFEEIRELRKNPLHPVIEWWQDNYLLIGRL